LSVLTSRTAELDWLAKYVTQLPPRLSFEATMRHGQVGFAGGGVVEKLNSEGSLCFARYSSQRGCLPI